MQTLLRYIKWENFEKVINKVKDACRNAGEQVDDHFPDVRKMVQIGSGTEREIEDIALSRYACYFVGQNGDSRKQEIAFAQTYFAVQTRRAEIVEQRLLDYERGVDEKGFAIIRSKGMRSGDRCEVCEGIFKRYGYSENKQEKAVNVVLGQSKFMADDFCRQLLVVN